MKRTLVVVTGIFFVLLIVSNTPIFIQNEQNIQTTLNRVLPIIHIFSILGLIVSIGLTLWAAYKSIKEYIDLQRRNVNVNDPKIKPHTKITYHPQGGIIGWRCFRQNEYGQLCSLSVDVAFEDGFLQSSYMPTKSDEYGV